MGENQTKMKTLQLAKLTLASIGLATLSLPASASAESCRNEQFRTGAAAALPDCRAYEVVSPQMSSPDRGAELFANEASLGGERFAWDTESALYPGSPTAGPEYLSTRTADGWSTQDMIPPQSAQTGICGNAAYIAAWAPDLSRSVLADGWNWTGYPLEPDDAGTANCGHDEPLLVEGEPQGAQNLFLHASDAPAQAGFYQLLNLTPPNLATRNAWLKAASADFGHFVFGSALALTPEAPLPPPSSGKNVREDVYDSAGGALRLVTILPGGSPTWGLLANSWNSEEFASANYTNAVSADGERVFFYAGGEISGGRYVGANLYARENAARPRSEECAGPGKACTVQLDVAQAGAAGPGGGGRFQWASADGSKVFFTDCDRLTEDSTAVASGGCEGFRTESGYQPPSGNDLYEYDLNKPEGQRLSDLTVDHEGTDALGADVQGLAGASEDGSYVYFVADGVLTGGEANQRGETAQAGQPNLYVRHASATTYIATLEAPDYERQLFGQCAWASHVRLEDTAHPTTVLCARLSSDGRFLVFDSLKSLTGYDSTVLNPQHPGERDAEIFRYDAAANTLDCTSCDPGGAPPTARFSQGPKIEAPTTAPTYNHGVPAYLTRYVSDSGRVFFDTANALLPADVNGTLDVYESEPPGDGSCAESSPAFRASDGGCLYLISSGSSPNPSQFKDASASGDDVFFVTGQGLVNSDSDNARSTYDARVGGGFAEPAASEEACDEKEKPCRPPISTPALASSPLTATFTGPGNLTPTPPPPPPKKRLCRKGFKKAKVHGRSVCKRVRKHHKHHRSTRHAGRNRHK
jgi:hypothetical protein